MSRYRLDDAAVVDLEELASYIAYDSSSAAHRTVDKLYTAFALLAASPGIGHRRADLTSFAVLFWTVDAYVVVYRRVAEFVEIVAVLHGSRHIPRLLKRRLAGAEGKR